jgi:sortase B cell surface sorting signal
MKLFKGIIVSAMAIVMLIPSFAFADDGPFIKDLSKLRAKPYEWQFYDENGKAIDKRVILADVKMKAISARHIETHGVKIQPDGKEFVKDYFNNRDNKLEDLKIRIGNSELFEDTICVIKNQDVKYSSDSDKESLKKLYLKDLGLDDKVEFADGWYFKEILYVCALPGSEIEVTNLYTRGKIRDGSFKLKVNEDCSLSPVDNTTQVDGDTVKMFLGKKPTDADKPNTDKPSVDKPNTDKPNTDNPNAGANTDKPSDKPNADKPNTDKPIIDNNKPTDKVDANKPVVNDKDSKVDASKVRIESNRPAVANKNSDTPKTSDNSNIALYSMLLIGSIGAIGVVFRRKLRTNK